jgi:hypothetical protein
LPASTTQSQLVALVENLPGLRSLDLITCEEIEDFTPLSSLAELEYLGVHAQTNLEAIAHLGNLRHLHILTDSGEFTEQPEAVTQLREALPDCDIVISIMPCLGSGYVPVAMAAALLVMMRVRRSRPKAPARSP